MGDDDLIDMDFDLPDRSFTLMDKQNKERAIEEAKKSQINEKYEAELKIKQEEIERLTEVLFGLKEQLKEVKNDNANWKEQLQIAEERLTTAI